MRKAFVATLLALAKRDSSIMLLTGDIGFNALEEFRDTLPKQFLNCGVAEQNMVSVATGLALEGRKVFVYSIIPFVTFRCLEQIRDDVCYHNLPICITGVGAGYAYGILGTTHHPIEDIGALRSFPNLRIVTPGDPFETEAAVEAIVHDFHPTYLRLGKAGEPKLYPAKPDFAIGKVLELQQGTDVLFLASGTMLETGQQAAAKLTEQGHSVHLVSVHSIKPFDEAFLLKQATSHKLIVTLEEHSIEGGLGSAAAETLSALGTHAPLLRIGAPDQFADIVGSQQFFRTKYGLTADAVSAKIQERLR